MFDLRIIFKIYFRFYIDMIGLEVWIRPEVSWKKEGMSDEDHNIDLTKLNVKWPKVWQVKNLRNNNI